MTSVNHSNERALLRSLPINVPGLKQVLGGGLPEYSFNLITGGPGTGKTTLGQQIMFGAAGPERRAVFFTILGEPTLKVLRYQQQFTFFDPTLVGSAIQFVHLGNEALHDLGRVLTRITEEVERTEPRIVVVDSFRSVAREGAAEADGGMPLDTFVQRLALLLTAWEMTSFMIGEYSGDDQSSPVFTVADSVFWLSQVVDRNSVVRKLQLLKVRGQAQMPGLHTFRITAHGLQIFPRIPEQQQSRAPATGKRQSTGVPGLDELMGGGIPEGDVVMIIGPPGAGKSTFATHFVAAAHAAGESAVVAVFEEYPEEYLSRGQERFPGLEEMTRVGTLKLIYLRPLDLSVDETLAEILDAVTEIGARRVVIDSLSGFAIALAPGFREDFQESLYRLVGALTAVGITVMLTAEAGFGNNRFTADNMSFITDAMIVLRYVEIEGKLQKVLAIVKMRGSDHSKEFRRYEVGRAGASVGGSLVDYHGITTGTPDVLTRTVSASYLGLTDREIRVLHALIQLGAASREGLATHVGLLLEDLEAVIARLVALGFAVADEDGRTFRAVAV